MKNAIVRWLAIGAVAAATTVGAGALASADTTPAGDAATAPPAVEDFAYPGDSPNPQLKLIRGDGHIMLADCNTVTQIQLWSVAVPSPSGGPGVCFRVTGTTGYLSLELPQTFMIQTGDKAVRADLTSEGVAQTVDVAKNSYTTVGQAMGQKPTMLVELRVTG
ncbi:hypothetical protein BX285_6898 [Streptomyces sp. 1114.5]|uniref:hypothetical protein n=1 Tax=unclassified Streptomyces TaxID=2593676 RepID=UPI000BC75B8F|nr:MULTISPECIES: hypothetical protein [unclassified Streptomyces]RKT09793.1 hypothetical protein BX285_6898 [Streptomyces sp. 1114.5]SOB88857.1 hypothetical protein SAMN06272789_7178 [Streptomyces sp. 1331.2]